MSALLISNQPFKASLVPFILTGFTIRSIAHFARSTNPSRIPLYWEYPRTLRAFFHTIFNWICNRVMIIVMFALAHYLQIFNSIIKNIAIYMVDMLVWIKLSTKIALHNVTMLFHSSTTDTNISISPDIDIPKTIFISPTLFIAHNVIIPQKEVQYNVGS